MIQRALPIVADTNALQSQRWDLGSGSMRIVEHECQEGRFALYVPEVVLIELEMHGQVEASNAAKRHAQNLRTLRELGEFGSAPDSPEITGAYPARLEARLEEFRATVV